MICLGFGMIFGSILIGGIVIDKFGHQITIKCISII